MTKDAIEARRAYQRDYHRRWAAKNPEKVRAIQLRYWERKAAEGQNRDAGRPE